MPEVNFLVTLTLTQRNLTFFLRIWKAKAATGNPQSVNAVNCFLLGASAAVNPNNARKCIMTLNFLILPTQFVISNTHIQFLAVGHDR